MLPQVVSVRGYLRTQIMAFALRLQEGMAIFPHQVNEAGTCGGEINSEIPAALFNAVANLTVGI
jgi:hypothetical protein